MKTTASLIITLLLGAMFVSLFHMSGSMDAHGGMSDCPFMVHEEAICPMNLSDHLSAWKSAFLAVMPAIVLLLVGALGFALVAPFLLLQRLQPIPIQKRELRERTYSFSYRPLQELFSNGILHPKIFQ